MQCVNPVQGLYRLAEGKSIPLNMLLELTYRCNERCLHCYLPETQGVRDPRIQDELRTQEWFRVLEELAEAGTLYLILTGGEVLLRDDFHDILRRARELAFSIEIFTNATLLTPAIADIWAGMDVGSVAISVYSPDAVWHDRVTKLKGSFAKTLQGIRWLKERNIKVTLKSPMMKLNFRNYEALIALAAELGVGHKFDPMMVPRNDGSDIPTRMELSGPQLKAVYRDEGLIPADDVLYSGPMNPQAPTCSAGRTSGAIGPYGDVVPCIQWMIPAGNVRERRFREIWSGGEIFQKARSYMAKDIKPCPECGEPHFIHCLGMSQLQKSDPLVPSSDACRLTRTIKEIQKETSATQNEEIRRYPKNHTPFRERVW